MVFRLNYSGFIVLVWTLCFLPSAQAQQQSLFSHYFWNEQHYNPAYAGSKDMLHVQALYRMQWVGMKGAPNTLNATVHSPLKNDKLALGINFYNDRIGAMQSNGITAQYAYRLKLADKYTLSMGLQGGVEFRNVNWAELHTDDLLPDPVGDALYAKSILPIVGAGVYFYSNQFSLGFGVPQLLPKTLFKGDQWGVEPSNNMFLSGSYQWNISEDFRLLPTATMRLAKGNPLQAEITASAILYDMFQAGIGVRTDKTAIFMAQFMPNIGDGKKKMRIGYSYDLSWKALRPSNSGSHELMISFGMPVFSQGSSPVIKSPRYF